MHKARGQGPFYRFLQQEKQYELYNDHNEHCDINQKLKYSDIRHEYLTHVIEARTKRELDAAPNPPLLGWRLPQEPRPAPAGQVLPRGIDLLSPCWELPGTQSSRWV